MSEELLKITVACKHCGRPLELSMFNSDDTTMMEAQRRLAALTVHEACATAILDGERAAAEDVRLRNRLDNWKTMCPPLYQSSQDWLNAEGFKKVNMRAVQKALDWQYSQRGLILKGANSGTGKTMSAYLLLHKMMHIEKMCVAISHIEFSDKVRDMAMAGHTQIMKRWMHLHKNCDLLLIDDLGKSRFTTKDGDGRAAEEAIFELIDYRATNLYPCIFTMNDSGESLAKRMSEERAEPFVRRLREFNDSINFDVQ